ncbi:MAG: hypothetical protein KA204_00085 [Chromatiaceae bacterium]|nr:hypothetical protein [Chromatiaceae bacterium]
MTLFKDDICYCHDAKCPQKDRCYRYVNRTLVEYAPHTATLRDPATGNCEYFIPFKGAQQ